MPTAVERERKFLVEDASFLRKLTPTRIAQGYLLASEQVEARVRLSGSDYTVTFKLGGAELSRLEEEIPLESPDIGEALLDSCPNRIIKDRYGVVEGVDSLWEVDVMLDRNEGLVLAEIELDNDHGARITIPEWCGREVTGVEFFYNASLSKFPFSEWPTVLREEYGLPTLPE